MVGMGNIGKLNNHQEMSNNTESWPLVMCILVFTNKVFMVS